MMIRSVLIIIACMNMNMVYAMRSESLLSARDIEMDIKYSLKNARLGTFVAVTGIHRSLGNYHELSKGSSIVDDCVKDYNSSIGQVDTVDREEVLRVVLEETSIPLETRYISILEGRYYYALINTWGLQRIDYLGADEALARAESEEKIIEIVDNIVRKHNDNKFKDSLSELERKRVLESVLIVFRNYNVKRAKL